MSILHRKKTECADHQWMSLITAGLRRDICGVCGKITLEIVSDHVQISETLKKAAAAAR